MSPDKARVDAGYFISVSRAACTRAYSALQLGSRAEICEVSRSAKAFDFLAQRAQGMRAEMAGAPFHAVRGAGERDKVAAGQARLDFGELFRGVGEKHADQLPQK